MKLHHEVEHPHGLMIRLAKLMLRGQDGADRRLDSLVVRGIVVKPDGIEGVRILKIAHRGKGNIDHAVYVVVSLLHFGAQNADNFKAETVKPDVFPQRVTSGNKL